MVPQYKNPKFAEYFIYLNFIPLVKNNIKYYFLRQQSLYGMDHLIDSSNEYYRQAYASNSQYIDRWRQSTQNLKRSYTGQRIGLLAELRGLRNKTVKRVRNMANRFQGRKF